MAPLIPLVVEMINWIFTALAVMMVPLLAAAMITRQVRRVGGKDIDFMDGDE